MTTAVLSGLLLAAAVLVLPSGNAAGGMAPEAGRRTRDLAGAEDGAAAPPSSAQYGPPTAADDVASALVLLALGYRSGLPTWQVLGAVADVLALTGGTADGAATSRSSSARPGQARPVIPAARDLRQVAAALRWGASDDEAWASVDPVWSGAGRAVAIAHRAGIPPAPLLLSAADDLRRASLEQVELAGARVGVRLVAPLGLVLLPAFLLTTVVPLVVALGQQMLRP